MENVIDQPMPSAGTEPSGRRRAVAALQVFAGGACYGVMATTYKLAYAAGFTSAQVVASQVWFGFLFFALAVLLSCLRGARWRHLAGRQMLKLIGLGAFLFALGATVTCSLFVTLSGKVKAPCSNKQRGLVVCLGVGVMSLTACPDYLVSGVVSQGILPFAAVAGFFGLMCPVLLFGLGSPHLPAGLSTVMAAAELPAGLLIAMVVLGEPLGVIEWLGVAVILAGVCLAQVPSLRATSIWRGLPSRIFSPEHVLEAVAYETASAGERDYAGALPGAPRHARLQRQSPSGSSESRNECARGGPQ